MTACGDQGVSCPNDLPSACPSPAPSYSQTIAPLISNRCFPCHAPGGQEAVTPLTTYSEVFARRTSVLTQVYHCQMPLAGSPQITASERAALLAWLVCDAPDN
jgi:uncharacterized membrane protein